MRVASSRSKTLARQDIQCALVCESGLTPGRIVRHHLARHGLLLAAQILSDEVGVPRPDPRMFRAALEPVGVNPERAFHVSDLRRTDVTTVRIRGRHDDEADLPDDDPVVDSHAELALCSGSLPISELSDSIRVSR